MANGTKYIIVENQAYLSKPTFIPDEVHTAQCIAHVQNYYVTAYLKLSADQN